MDVSIAAGQGTVSPDTETVDYGSTVTIDFTPGLGYRIGSITDNGVEVPISDPYVLTNLTGDHPIVVTFVEIAFYFAEGYTGENFQEYLCLGQPGDAPLPVRVTYLFPGEKPMEKIYTVPAHSRLTVDVNAEVGPGPRGFHQVRRRLPLRFRAPHVLQLQGGLGRRTRLRRGHPARRHLVLRRGLHRPRV